MKIEIINKEDFKEYKDSIDRIHLENAYPNGYLIDDDYLTKALKVVLVFVNDRVVGYASISKEKIHSDPGSDFNIIVSSNNIKISQVALRGEYQDKGIGTTLFNYIKKYAKDNNIDYIYLYSMSTNKRGQKFYLKNGFTFSGIWHSDEYKGIKNFKSYFYSYKVK